MPGHKKTKNIVGKMRGGGKVEKMRGGGKVGKMSMLKGGGKVKKKGKKKSVVKKRG